MVRLGLVGALVVVLVLTSCSSLDTSGGSADSSSATSTRVPSTTVPAATSTVASTTSSTTTTAAPSTTTSMTTVPPDSADAATWIGHHFVVVDDTGTVLTRDFVLFAGCGDSILIGGQDAGVDPWFVGFDSQPDVMIVAPDPMECPPEDADPPDAAPVLPIDPGSDDPYTLSVWALAPSADLYSGYRITDAMAVEFPQSVLATLDFISVEYEHGGCDLDASLDPEELFGFFEVSDSLKIETQYPSVFAFRVQHSALEIVPPDMVSCVVLKDPENY